MPFEFRCETCGIKFVSRGSSRKYCSRKCLGIANGKRIAKTRTGENNPYWKGGIPKWTCLECGKEFLAYPYNKEVDKKFCSISCYRSWAIGENSIWYGRQLYGKDNPNWKGDKCKTPETQRIRESQEYKEWRKAVFERDNYACQDCGQEGGYLQAHHIKSFSNYPELRFEVSNGETKCLACHEKFHGSVLFHGRGT